jgi:hypothetical protein
MAETAVGPAGSSAEASLEEIEDDVSLDSFGSGSGLLDLSLQADDTSLGGILDEIYTPEGEGKAKPADEAGEGETVAQVFIGLAVGFGKKINDGTIIRPGCQMYYGRYEKTWCFSESAPIRGTAILPKM